MFSDPCIYHVQEDFVLCFVYAGLGPYAYTTYKYAGFMWNYCLHNVCCGGSHGSVVYLITILFMQGC